MAFFGVGGRGGGGGGGTGAGRYGTGGYRYAYAQPQEEEEEEQGPGFLSSGIGPDIGLGGISLAKEIGGGISGLAKLGTSLLPGGTPAGEAWSAAGRGFASSLLGTVATVAKPIGFGFGDRPIEALGAKLLGEDYRPKDFAEKVRERGILPALVEDIGNVALVGAVAKAPLAASAAASRRSGNFTRAATMARRSARLDPVVYPYRTAMRAHVRPRLSAAQERYLHAAGGAVRATEAAPAPIPGTATEAARVVDKAEAAAQVAEKRAARLREAAKPFSDEAPSPWPGRTARATQMAEELYDQDPSLAHRLANDHIGGMPRENVVASLRNDIVTGRGANSAVQQLTERLDIEDPRRTTTPQASPPHERLAELAARADEMAASRRTAADEAKASAEEAWQGKPIGRDTLADRPAGPGQTINSTKFRQRIRELSQGVRNAEGIPGVSLRTRLAAHAAGWMDTTDMIRRTHVERRLMEAARRSIVRSPGYQSALSAAEQYLVSRGVSPQDASNILGDEVAARLSGVHQLAEDLGGAQIHELLRQSGFRKHLAPEELRGSPEWEQALTDVTQAMREEHARAFDTLTRGRKEFEGVERAGIDAMELLDPQQRQVAMAAHERLSAAKLDKKIQAQQAIQGRRIAGAEDSVGRMAERLQRLDEARAGAIAAFDETRTYIAPAFDKARRAATYQTIIDRTRQSWEDSGRQFGGATFNPHTGALFDPHTGPGGRFVEAGEEAYAVGVVNDTAVKVPLDELTPDHIDRMVRAFQDLYENREIMIGTWVDAEGNVHIDPSQVVTNRDRALTLAAARGQEAIWDNAASDTVTPYLNTRQDVAARFVAQDKFRSRRAAELREAARSDRHNITDSDVDKFMALDDLIATSAFEKGLYNHPDEWYRSKQFQLRRGRRFLRKNTVEQQLNQTYLKRDYNARLWDDVTKYMGPQQLENAMGWYHRSHQWVRSKFAGKTITLADGVARPADEVFFQILAVTSVQASPTTNLGNAMKATANINRFMALPEFESLRNTWANTLAKAADEGWTRTEIMEALFPEALVEKSSKARKKAVLSSDLGEPLTGSVRGSEAAQKAKARGEVYTGMEGLNAHMYDFAKTLVHEILTGNTMDKWNAGVINEITRAWTGKAKFTDQAFQRLVERFGGDDIAAMEHFGGELWAKLRSFHSNLADPVNSDLATLDSWMARLLDLPNWDTPGTYAAYAGKLREMAEYAGRPVEEGGLGRVVKAHEIQAALWAYAKLEIGRQNWGRLMGFASDTLARLEGGNWSAVDDPTAAYFLEDIAGSEAARGRMKTGEDLVDEVTETGEEAVEPGFRVERRQIRRPYLPGPEGARLDVRPIEWPKTRDEINALKDRLMEEEGIAPPRAGARISDERARALIDRRFREDLRRARVRKETQHKAYPTRLEGRVVVDADGNLLPPKKDRSGNLIVPEGASVKTVLKSEEALARYQKVQREMASAIDRGDLDGARATYMRWVNGQRKTILDEEWGDFNDIASNTGAADLQFAMEAVREQGLMQSFEKQIYGTMQAKESRYIIRLYRDADFTTLVHENAHVLRQILPDHQIDTLQRAYGITNGRWTTENEERFADDFMGYLANDGKIGALIRNPELGDIFANVRRHLSEYWDGAASHILADDINPAVARLFDNWLNPNKVRRPEGVIGIAARAPETGTPAQLGMRAPDIPLGTPAQAFRRGARGQRALREMERIEVRRAQVAAAKSHAEANLGELRRILNEHELPAQIRQRELRESSARRLESVDEAVREAPVHLWPRAWQPLGEAIEGIRDQIDKVPELAQILDGRLPTTFDDAVRFAYDHGFRPEHVRDFRPELVQRLVFESMKVGRPALGDIGQEVTAGVRRASRGTLRKTGEVDRSLEALIAGSVEAVHEMHTNNLVTWIEKNLARRVPENGQIPPGWAAWDPARQLLLTGEELASGATQARAGTQFMIPKPAASNLRRMTRNYEHWALNAIGTVMKPWRAWILSLNPRYYVNNIIGNMVLAGMAGAVNPLDWAKAWRAYRGTEIAGRQVRFYGSPIGAEEITRVHGIQAKAGGTMVRSTPGRRYDLGLARRGAPIRGRGSDALNRLNRINESADAFARSAVYYSQRRKGFSNEAAINKAYEAMVDYGSLSPFERQVVRTIVPFYAWQRGILKLVMKMPYDHPARVAFLMSMSQYNDDAAMDMLGLTDPSQVPDDYRHVMQLPGVAKYLSVKQLNPFGDAHQLATPQGIASSMNPIVEAIVRKGFGAPEGGFAESYRMNAWGGAEPDMNLGANIAENLIMSGPTPAALQLAGVSEGVGGRPIGGTSALRWAGMPVMPAEQVERARKRVRKTVARMEGRSLAKEEEGAAGPSFFGGAGGGRRRGGRQGFF